MKKTVLAVALGLPAEVQIDARDWQFAGEPERLAPVVASEHLADLLDPPVVNDVLQSRPLPIGPVAVIAEELDDPLGRGDPDLDTPPHIIEAVNQAIRDGKTGLSPIAGMPALREAIAWKLQQENRLPVDAENVIVTTGGQEALFLIMQTLLDPGDEALIEHPAYGLLVEVALNLGAEVKRFVRPEESGFALDPAEIRRSITPKTKLIAITKERERDVRLVVKTVLAWVFAEGRSVYFYFGRWRSLGSCRQLRPWEEHCKRSNIGKEKATA